MDITPTPTTTTTTPPTPTQTSNTLTTKSPDLDTETPTRIQSTKPLSFTNGVLKRHHPHHHHNHNHNHNHHHLLHHAPIIIIYKECLKNHAATMGGHALDGCGEFMPSPTATATDPTSLKCAACGCHRNFHRKEPEDPPPTPTTTIEYQPHHRHHPPPPPPPPQPPLPQSYRSPNSASPPPISSSYYPSGPHMLLALSGNLHGPPDSNTNANISISPTGITNPSSNTRKRFRTKFSQSQKEKMLQFADSVGWKMQKRDEDSVQEFCNEVGVDKGVLKVWMHNNKNTLAKRDMNGNGGGDDDDGRDNNDNHNLENNNNNNNNNNLENNINNNNNSNSNEDNNNNEQNMDHFESDGVAHVGTNGSSSSS